MGSVTDLAGLGLLRFGDGDAFFRPREFERRAEFDLDREVERERDDFASLMLISIGNRPRR